MKHQLGVSARGKSCTFESLVEVMHFDLKQVSDNGHTDSLQYKHYTYS